MSALNPRLRESEVLESFSGAPLLLQSDLKLVPRDILQLLDRNERACAELKAPRHVSDWDVVEEDWGRGGDRLKLPSSSHGTQGGWWSANIKIDALCQLSPSTERTRFVRFVHFQVCVFSPTQNVLGCACIASTTTRVESEYAMISYQENDLLLGFCHPPVMLPHRKLC